MEKYVYADANAVADTAIEVTLQTLRSAIADHGSAVWVLAGGTSPMSAYRKLSSSNDAFDWPKVTAVIGDERHVPLDDSNSNWGQISAVLFSGAQTARIVGIAPDASVSVLDSAQDYSRKLESLGGAVKGIPRLDVVWLGVGEDGHTLSLFPGHPDFVDNGRAVRAVHNSPKPPPNRITLTLRALSNVGQAIVFATGAGKRDALARATQDRLPIALAAEHIEASGGRVTWLFDAAADGA